MRVAFGVVLIVCVLVPANLYLFGIVSDAQAAALVLLLAGLWAILFGVAFGSKKERLYTVGVGLIVADLSTFLFVSPQYTAGLVVASIIAVVIASIALGQKTNLKSPPRAT